MSERTQPAFGEDLNAPAKGRDAQIAASSQDNTWEGALRRHAQACGYEVEAISYDPAYGWTVLLDDGTEIERRSTTGVRIAMEALRDANP